MACHFSYGVIFPSLFFIRNIPNPNYNPSLYDPNDDSTWAYSPTIADHLTNTDNTNFDTSNPTRNNWADRIVNIKFDAAIDNLSGFSLFFFLNYYKNNFDNTVFDNLPNTEVYTIDEDTRFGNTYTWIGYNFNTDKVTVTHSSSWLTPFNSIKDFTFNGTATNIDNFFTEMNNTLPAYVKSNYFFPASYVNPAVTAQAREMLTFISRSFSNTSMNQANEREYVGSAINIKQLSNLNLSKLSKVLSVIPSRMINPCIMTMTATTNDTDVPLATLKTIEFEMIK